MITELFHKAMAVCDDEDKQLEVVCSITNCEPRKVMKYLRKYIVSPKVKERFLAVWVMGELGYPRRPFLHERTRFLEKAIAEDSSIRVRAQAILSLGRLVATQADTTIMRYACHRSAKLRLAVAQSLSTSSNPKTIKCLIKLSTDRASIVRDWATFMLGLQREKGSPIIVKALKKRLKDTSRFVRFEAITALICHKQIEVSLHLEDELERKHVDYVLINAVQELAYLAENNIKKSQKKSKARKK